MTVVPNETPLAPQVVTIVHRLTGVKLLRLLQSQSGAHVTIENIDPQTLMTDAHASIIAGWVLADGRTIAARLPQAVAEIEITATVETRARAQAQSAVASAAPWSLIPSAKPDLTVITGDGQKFRAQLVGLDGQTGLSMLQVIGGPLPVPATKPAELSTGQAVQIFSPQPVSNESETAPRTTYVKVEKVEATLAAVSAAPTTAPDKLIVRGSNFSPSVVGGIACDPNGNTLGIVESVDGNDASVLSALTVAAASKRVLERQGSVPRPLLGVQGQAIQFAGMAGLVAHGWQNDQAKDLINHYYGILLTSVAPKTPAAAAKLQAGDVIVSVNQKDVKTAEDFSYYLADAGSGEQVQFTVRRPAAATPFEVPVTLGGSFVPSFPEWNFNFGETNTPFVALQSFGMQVVGLSGKAALEFGAQNGLIVLAVQANSAAARSGIREGDVIESIDGHVLAPEAFTLALARQRKHTISLVRDREKKQVVLESEQ